MKSEVLEQVLEVWQRVKKAHEARIILVYVPSERLYFTCNEDEVKFSDVFNGCNFYFMKGHKYTWFNEHFFSDTARKLIANGYKIGTATIES